MYTMEYYLAMGKKGVLSFATTWMELEVIMLSEISQTKKDKYRMTRFDVQVKKKKEKKTTQRNRVHWGSPGPEAWETGEMSTEV